MVYPDEKDWLLFLAFVLALREGLEMALIIGIVLGALSKLERPDLKRAVWLGVLSAGLLSLGVAIVLQWLGARLEEPYEQLFEGVMLLLAAGVLTWMIFWMQRQARNLKGQVEGEVRLAAVKNGQRGMFSLAFIAVLREGIELALFLTAAALAAGQAPTIFGAIGGLVAAGLLGWAFLAASIRLNLRRFFQITGFLLILFAAGLAAHGVHEFIEIGLVPALIEPVWNSSAIMANDSPLGSILRALVGYNASPSLMEVLVYWGYLATVAIAVWMNRQTVIPETG